MEKLNPSVIQANMFDFALAELVRNQRNTFKPLWTLDSWAKFLIWVSLNCGLSGEKDSLETFANALGLTLTIKMRKIFFERSVDHLCVHLIADPSEPNVLVMPTHGCDVFTYQTCKTALDKVGLSEKVTLDFHRWESHDQLIAIPWISSESAC